MLWWGAESLRDVHADGDADAHGDADRRDVLSVRQRHARARDVFRRQRQWMSRLPAGSRAACCVSWRCGAGWLEWALRDVHRDSNGNEDAHTNEYIDAHTNGHSDSDIYSDGDTDPYVDDYPDTNKYSGLLLLPCELFGIVHGCV